MAINTPLRTYKEMASKWRLPLALWGGTAKMREQSDLWLPRMSKEDKEVYELRVQRSFLFNVYKRTIESMVGNAFNNNLTVSGAPKGLEYLEWNANGQGQSLTEHAAELFQDNLKFGKCHNYVDFPTTDINRVSYTEYKQLGLKPYLARVSPINLIGWDLAYNNGFENIEHIRILDSETIINSDWEEEEREIVRLVTPDFIRVYGRPFSSVSKLGDGDFELLSEIPNSLGYVPLQSGYANKTGTFLADPTLEDLAWLNLQHFQSSSDQHNILHIARVPFLIGTGFEEKDLANLVISANEMVVSGNKDAQIRYVEHTGNAINAGRTHGKDLEEQMNRSGAEILFSQSVARQTAQGRKIDQAESLSVAQRSLRSIEQMLEQCYLVAADWLDIEPDFDIRVNIGADLNLAEEPNPITGFIELANFFGFDPEVALEEAKRRGLIAKHLTVKDIELMEREQPEPILNNQTADSSATNEPEQSREDN